MFFCEFCEISKNIFFPEHPCTTASENTLLTFSSLNKILKNTRFCLIFPFFMSRLLNISGLQFVHSVSCSCRNIQIRSCITNYFRQYVLYVVLCYSIVTFDTWEILPSAAKLNEKIGEGAFGAVYRGNLSRDVYRKTPYHKLNRRNLERKDTRNVVAVKRLKGFYNINISTFNIFVKNCFCR